MSPWRRAALFLIAAAELALDRAESQLLALKARVDGRALDDELAAGDALASRLRGSLPRRVRFAADVRSIEPLILRAAIWRKHADAAHNSKPVAVNLGSKVIEFDRGTSRHARPMGSSG